jgi:hypothetical protein
MPSPTERQLQAALSPHGLHLRGAFAPTPEDGLPNLPNGQHAASVWMVGVVGSSFWPHFKASAFFSDSRPDPLDRWSRAIGEELAARWGGLALFPFDGPPYHPFQRWADRSEATQPSRMLLRIHPQHGLWHAYRFALALPASSDTADTVPSSPTPSTDLCATCSGQPCLQACPVGAYTGATFLLDACASHLHSGQGEDCMQSGCLARRACPVAPGLRYTPEHAAFHMQAFAERH